MMRWALMAVACLVACAPTAPAPAQSAAPQASAALAAAFPNCTWGEVRGAGLSMWSFACPGDRIVADASLPGLVREIGEGDQAMRHPVVRVFEIAEGASLDSILPAVRVASPAEGIASCLFAPAEGHDGWFVLKPTGALRDAYDRFISSGDGPSQPCGELGPSEAGARYFFRLPGATTKAVVVDEGSDISPFDVATLRAAS